MAAVVSQVNNSAAARAAALAKLDSAAFQDDQAVGEAVHETIGFVSASGVSPSAVRWRVLPPEPEVESQLREMPEFTWKCAVSPEAFFFGPTRELIRRVALRIHRVHINLRRFRRVAWRVAYLGMSLREAHARASERANVPGGLGFQAAMASFDEHRAQQTQRTE